MLARKGGMLQALRVQLGLRLALRSNEGASVASCLERQDFSSMKTALFTAFILAILSAPVHAGGWLVVSMSGEVAPIDMPEQPPMRLQDPWYSVSLDGSF